MGKQSVDIILKAHDKASKKFGKVGKSAKGLSGVFKGLGVAVGAYVGVRALKSFVSDSLAAFGQQETAVQHLSDALTNLQSKSELEGLKKFARELQNVTTIGDETTLEIMALGASMGNMSGDTLKAATTAAIGFSKSLGMDMKAAMTLVAKAAQGNTDTFTRYGIMLDKNMTDAEKFQAILEKGAAGFAMAKGETETYTGKMQQLSNTWGDFKETIGEAISSYLPGLGENFKTLEVGIENWRAVMDLTWLSVKLGLIGFAEDARHLLVVQIPQALGWFSRNWKEVFIDIFNMTTTVFTNMWTNVRNFFTSVWSWLKGDGFDFEWTGLTEGFESAIKEMPEIAKREMTAVEKELLKSVDNIKLDLAERLATKIDAQGPDIKALVDGMKMPGQKPGEKPVLAGKKAGAGGSTLAARESRFMTYSRGTPQQKAADKTATNTEKTAKGIQELIKVVLKQPSGSGGQATVLLAANLP